MHFIKQLILKHKLSFVSLKSTSSFLISPKHLSTLSDAFYRTLHKHSINHHNLSPDPIFGFPKTNQKPTSDIEKHIQESLSKGSKSFGESCVRNQEENLCFTETTTESSPEHENQVSGLMSDGSNNFEKLRFVILKKTSRFKTSYREEGADEYSKDVEKIYRILRKFHARVPKLEIALKESGVSMSSVLVQRVLGRCGDAGSMGYRFYAWASKQPGYTHSYDVFKSLIKSLSKMRQFGAVWAIIEEMRKENPELLTADVFVVLMRRCASARMVQKAIEVLDEMPKYGCEPDERVFGCLLDALCKNGSVKEAASLFEDMRIRFTPNLKHFTSLLYGWCKVGKLMEAKYVIVQMRQAGFAPDVVAFNNLLTGYTAAGKIQDGLHLIQEMKRVQCNPNATSYTIIIQALCAKKRMDEAMLVFDEMGKNGCVADVVTYTTMISGFCKWGKINKGYELVKDMIKKGCIPNQLTYFHILAALEKKKQMEEMLELIEEMEKNGCPPDLNIYNVMIRLAFKLDDIEEAVRFWNRIEASGLSPGVDTYVIMIHGFLSQDCLIEACGYFKDMVERGLFSVPQYGILKETLNPLLRQEKLELAKDLWVFIVSSGCDLNVYAWTIWLHALFAVGHVKEACYYCTEMLDAGIMPQPDTFAKLMQGLKKLYNREIAALITERVRQMAADRNVSFKMYKRRGINDLKEKVKPKMDGRGVRDANVKLDTKRVGNRSKNRCAGAHRRNRDTNL